MRQLTCPVPDGSIRQLSKLPMRQLTNGTEDLKKARFSKLPMRQLTGLRVIGTD